MSSPLAIGAVSAVLRNLLDNGMVDVGPSIGSVSVSAVAPDTIRVDLPDRPPSLNLFLYRVTPNQGLWNAGQPSRSPDGRPTTNPPLALNLHYLLTAYGDADFEAEILLGYAMHVLHNRPVLDRAAIRRALSPSPLGPSILPPAYQALAAADLADQAEAITVTLEPMDTEDMSKLWSATQAHYRPSAAYVVSVVLIASTTPTRAALPVLSRGLVDPATGRDSGVSVEPSLLPPLPTITGAGRAAHPSQPALRLGEVLELVGHHLDGTGAVVHLTHPLVDPPRTLPLGVVTDPNRVEVTLPSGPTAEQDWPAGAWTVSVEVLRPGEAIPRTSNAAAVLLAPEPVLVPPPVLVRDGGTGALSVALQVRPQVRPTQAVSLALDADVARASAHPSPTGTVGFTFGAVPAGPAWVRLVVDGVESLLVDRSSTPPSFDPTQRVTVPA